MEKAFSPFRKQVFVDCCSLAGPAGTLAWHGVSIACAVHSQTGVLTVLPNNSGTVNSNQQRSFWLDFSHPTTKVLCVFRNWALSFFLSIHISGNSLHCLRLHESPWSTICQKVDYQLQWDLHLMNYSFWAYLFTHTHTIFFQTLCNVYRNKMLEGLSYLLCYVSGVPHYTKRLPIISQLCLALVPYENRFPMPAPLFEFVWFSDAFLHL